VARLVLRDLNRLHYDLNEGVDGLYQALHGSVDDSGMPVSLAQVVEGIFNALYDLGTILSDHRLAVLATKGQGVAKTLDPGEDEQFSPLWTPRIARAYERVEAFIDVDYWAADEQEGYRHYREYVELLVLFFDTLRGELPRKRKASYEGVARVQAALIEIERRLAEMSESRAGLREDRKVHLRRLAESRERVLLRPAGWGTTGDEGFAFLERLRKPGHVYRGMTSEEYQATVGAGKPIQSTLRYSHNSEGTSFTEDPGNAESYANYGQDDPRRTGRPTWLIEIKRTSTMYDDRDGYTKDRTPVPLSAVTGVWKMFALDDEIHAERVR
jgi:hypothetical protein